MFKKERKRYYSFSNNARFHQKKETLGCNIVIGVRLKEKIFQKLFFFPHRDESQESECQ